MQIYTFTVTEHVAHDSSHLDAELRCFPSGTK